MVVDVLFNSLSLVTLGVRALDCRVVFALGLAVWACSGVTWGICSVVFDL